MPDFRQQDEVELIAAIQAALPGVRVEALASEEQLQGQAQSWPAVFLLLSSITWGPAQVVHAPDRQPATWSWLIFCHGRKSPPPPELSAFALCDAVISRLSGFRLSDPKASPIQIASENIFALLYDSQIRAIEISYYRRPA